MRTTQEIVHDYKGYNINFVPKNEVWHVELGAGNVVENKSLKEVMKAVRAHTKENKVTLTPFWAIMSRYEKVERVYVVNINTRNNLLYYKTSEKGNKIKSVETRWGTYLYPDTKESYAIIKSHKEGDEAVRKAEREQEKLDAKLERLALTPFGIAEKLGKE